MELPLTAIDFSKVVVAQGGRVVHDSCGLGRVLSVSEHFVTVDFGSAGVKRLLLRYAPVEKL